MNVLEWILHPVAYAAAIGVCLLLVGVVPNRWIKRRIFYSIVLFLVAGLLPVGLGYLLGESGLENDDLALLGMVSVALTSVAVLNALVALVFNPIRKQGVSDRWPAIVQDVIVLAPVLVWALRYFSQQGLALGVAGSVVIGIALKDTLGNLFAGLALQSEKPFRVGDWVVFGQHEGRVLEATWRATKIRTKAGNFVIVPNSIISEEAIVNYSQPTRILRLEKVVRMAHEVRPNDFKNAAIGVLREIVGVLEDPPPEVLTSEYDEYSIQYRVRFWIDGYTRSEQITDEVGTQLYYGIQRAGLGIPLPRQIVKIDRGGDPKLQRRSNRRLDFVESVDLFAVLKDESRELIARQMRPYTFGAGEVVIRQGAAGESMFFIARGKIRVLLRQDGAMRELAVLGQGQYLGEMALLTGEPRAASAVAVGDTDVFVLDKAGFRKVLLADEGVASQMASVVASRKELLEEKQTELGSEVAARHKAEQNVLAKISDFFGL